MLAAGRRILTVLFVFAVCLMDGAPAYSQSSSILNSSNSADIRTSSRAWFAKCAEHSIGMLAGERSSEMLEWPVAGVARNATPGEFRVPSAPETLCVESALPGPPRPAADNPCPESVGGTPGCKDGADAALAELSAFGKAGAKIARAREGVLDILRTANACTEWFATKDAIPAATFQSLSFVLDKNGPQDVLEEKEDGSTLLFRQPYVASATQDGGAHTAITINAHGAFYRPQGSVLKVFREGGPVQADGTRYLTVGSYQGNTLPAQMVTLLHEFGHIIDLLPEDADNWDGKSVKNTDEVLRHCRAEVEAWSQFAKQATKR